MITIENLSFSYAKHPVFKDLSMTLEEGSIYGLLGQNGVGKTTLMKIFSGLLKSNSGNLTVNGFDPFLRKPEFLKDIFFVPEDYSAPSVSVESFVKNLGIFYPNFNLAEFYNMMSVFEVNPSDKFTKLSNGQIKKAIISVALSLNTPLLLLDEPSNGLDIPSKAQLRKVILQNMNEHRIIIISTHQVRDLENLIDPIIILDRDGILLNASIEKISNKLYFGLNSTKNEAAIYSEPTLGGYMEVALNDKNLESKVNIEALFNTALINKQLIKNLFNE